MLGHHGARRALGPPAVRAGNYLFVTGLALAALVEIDLIVKP